MKAYSITPKGQVTIPVQIREKLKLKAGDKIMYENTKNGILLKPAKGNMLADFGFLKGIQKPKKDFDVMRKAVREKMAKRAK